MNITELNNKTIYLDDLADLTVAGSIAYPTAIVLRETGGAIIMQTNNYADFSGEIRLDLTDIFKPYAIPALPYDGKGSDAEQELDLTITVAGRSYSFTLILLHSEAETRYSDIDLLRIPDYPLPMSAIAPNGGTVAFVAESPAGLQNVHEAGPFNSRAVAYTLIDPSQVTKGMDGKFRVTASTGNHILQSPTYQVQPGNWQMFLFKNRLGYLEFFPMSGDLQIIPSYQFNNARYGRYHKKASTECDIVLQQYTGPLTRKASQALAGMLEDGFAYHFTDGGWKRIVIEEASVNISSYGTIHKQSFSFRYQDPVTIPDITI